MPAVIRPAQVRDIACLEEIENAADTLLVRFLNPVDWESAPSGQARASTTGFILVAADSEDDDACGFVHVLEFEGFAHLEQLSVVPERGQQGVGRELVDASLTEAARRGFESMTLRTYADVPWNAPFYATCGFVESDAEAQFHQELQSVEAGLGLERYGRRIQMSAVLHC